MGFTSLPQEIAINILSRLPVRTIVRCKCVCKPWLDLIEGSDFATWHLSQWSPSDSCLAVIMDPTSPKPLRICDEVHRDGCATLLDFGLPPHEEWSPLRPPRFEQCMVKMRLSSADGLLLLFDERGKPDSSLFVCNPITREYALIPPPRGCLSYASVLGFGASKITNQYKVVVIFNVACMQESKEQTLIPECQVYTLGSTLTRTRIRTRTGVWRSIATAMGKYEHDDDRGAGGVFLKGNHHWVSCDRPSFETRVSCLDLETELYTSFSLPSAAASYSGGYQLFEMRGRLCLCDSTTSFRKVVIWSMNEYGDEQSWVREIVVQKARFCMGQVYHPIKVMEEGDILFRVAGFSHRLYICSTKETNGECFKKYRLLQARKFTVDYTPSFLSLGSMGVQNVASFS